MVSRTIWCTGCRKTAFWAAGTGYGAGRGSSETWDANASEAAQAARDAELQRLLDSIAAALSSELGSQELEEQIKQLDLGTGRSGACRLRPMDGVASLVPAAAP